MRGSFRTNSRSFSSAARTGACAVLLLGLAAAGSSLLGAQSTSDVPPSDRPTRPLHRSGQTAPNVAPSVPIAPAAQTPAASADAPAPEMPKWPVNETASKPSVEWDSKGLQIEATNSSLRQILNDVSMRTGAKVEGLATDERVFGTYGPGQARDVLSQLLQGAGYNVLMIGDQGEGTPSEIVLSARTTGAGVPARGNAGQPQGSQDEDSPEPEPDEQPAPIMNRMPGAPRTPQQMLQELQQRQQQMQDNQQPH